MIPDGSKPKIFVLDVDGVMTDGRFYYSESGKIIKVFGADDHDALCVLKPYLSIHFVTGDHRGFEISKSRIVNDMKMKLDLVSTVERLDWIKQHWPLKDVIYMGDGLFDGLVFQKVRYSIAPENGDSLAKSCADYVTKRSGGDRAVSEACMHILEKFFIPFSYENLPKKNVKLSGRWAFQQK